MIDCKKTIKNKNLEGRARFYLDTKLSLGIIQFLLLLFKDRVVILLIHEVYAFDIQKVLFHSTDESKVKLISAFKRSCG